MKISRLIAILIFIWAGSQYGQDPNLPEDSSPLSGRYAGAIERRKAKIDLAKLQNEFSALPSPITQQAADNLTQQISNFQSNYPGMFTSDITTLSQQLQTDVNAKNDLSTLQNGLGALPSPITQQDADNFTQQINTFQSNYPNMFTADLTTLTNQLQTKLTNSAQSAFKNLITTFNNLPSDITQNDVDNFTNDINQFKNNYTSVITDSMSQQLSNLSSQLQQREQTDFNQQAQAALTKLKNDFSKLSVYISQNDYNQFMQKIENFQSNYPNMFTADLTTLTNQLQTKINAQNDLSTLQNAFNALPDYITQQQADNFTKNINNFSKTYSQLFTADIATLTKQLQAKLQDSLQHQQQLAIAQQAQTTLQSLQSKFTSLPRYITQDNFNAFAKNISDFKNTYSSVITDSMTTQLSIIIQGLQSKLQAYLKQQQEISEDDQAQTELDSLNQEFKTFS